MLKTIIPFISEVQAYRDKNIVETSFDVMLPKTLHVVTDALTLLPDISWIEMCKSKPLNKHNLTIYMLLSERYTFTHCIPLPFKVSSVSIPNIFISWRTNRIRIFS